MIKAKSLFLSVLLVLTILVSGCSEQQPTSSNVSDDNISQSVASETGNTADGIASENPPAESTTPNDTAEESTDSAPQPTKNVISVDDIPAYTGEAYISINGNVPFFEESEYSTTSFEQYSALDSLGRCGVAYANIGQDLMPTEDRGSISSVTPSGWVNKNYGDFEQHPIC